MLVRYNSWKKDVQLSSISGGTDIISCFALGNPILPAFHTAMIRSRTQSQSKEQQKQLPTPVTEVNTPQESATSSKNKPHVPSNTGQQMSSRETATLPNQVSN